MTRTSMPRRALVVYETMFANTEAVAKAIAAGLGQEGYDATAVDVQLVDLVSPMDVDLLVIGAPTHAFSISRSATREDAVRQGASPARAAGGVREWLATLPTEQHGQGPAVAAFDTRIAKARRLPAAAGRISRAARRAGLRIVVRPEGFLVEDTKGPLRDGETERAAQWGRTLAHLERGTKGPTVSAPCP